MSPDLIETIRSQSTALVPQETGSAARIPQLENIKAVVFDIYGTLVISASGDISIATSMSKGAAFKAGVEAIGLRCLGDADRGSALLMESIRSEQKRIGADGRLQSEIEIRRCWKDCLIAAASAGIIDRACDDNAAIEEREPNPNIRTGNDFFANLSGLSPSINKINK